jgi:hypothetical protein
MCKSRLKDLYAILQKLECELQTLGARPDFGVPMEPNFAAETLVSCLCLLSKQSGARSDYLLDAAQELLDVVVKRELDREGKYPRTSTFADLQDAQSANDLTFAAMFHEYQKKFQAPISKSQVTGEAL